MVFVHMMVVYWPSGPCSDLMCRRNILPLSSC